MMSRVVHESSVAVEVTGSRRQWWAGVLLDVARRAGAVALLAGVAVLVLIGKGSPVKVPLAVAAAVADVGLCAAWGARLLSVDPIVRRRTAGVLLFCLVVFALSLLTMLLDRLGAIGTEAADVVALAVAALTAAGLLAWLAAVPAGRRRGGGVPLLCLVLFLLALHTLLLDRLPTIGADVADFFTPAPVTAGNR